MKWNWTPFSLQLLRRYAESCNLDIEPLKRHIDSDRFAFQQFMDWIHNKA